MAYPGATPMFQASTRDLRTLPSGRGDYHRRERPKVSAKVEVKDKFIFVQKL